MITNRLKRFFFSSFLYRFVTGTYDADIDEDDENFVNEDLLWKPYI